MDLQRNLPASLRELETNSERGDASPIHEAVAQAARDLQAVATLLLDPRAPLIDRPEQQIDAVITAKNILLARKETDKLLAELEISHGPGFDILLDLFVNESLARPVSVTEASIAGRCPSTTGLRWVKILMDTGVIQKQDDLSDQRRSFLSLTPKGKNITLCCIQSFAKILSPKLPPNGGESVRV